MRQWTGWLLAALAVALLTSIALARLTVPGDQYGDLSPDALDRYVVFALAAGAVYLAGVAVVRAWAVPRWALSVGLLAGLLARGVMVVTPPVMSTDLYRYVWDGRVQAAGINPYRYIPADPALAFVRDGLTGPSAVFINMNRPETARTIYPPAAQWLFAAIGQIASSVWTVKWTMLAMDVIAGVAAWGLLRMAGRPAAWLLVWAWNPLAIMEFSGAGHIDAAAMAASAVALLLAARGRAGAAGAALGVAVLFKLLPAALGPAIWRPRGIRAPAVALAVIAAGYATYASAGPYLLGYLSGYAQEEQLEEGGGFLLLRLLALAGKLPVWAGLVYAGAGLAVLAGLTFHVVRRDGPARADVIARDALVLSAGLLVTLSPHYPWYLTMLIVPAVVVPSFGALWPTVAGPLLYWDGGLAGPWWAAIVFGPVALWLISEVLRGIEHA